MSNENNTAIIIDERRVKAASSAMIGPTPKIALSITESKLSRDLRILLRFMTISEETFWFT